MKNTNEIRHRPGSQGTVDAVDRRILSALAEDSSTSYAALGERVGLSPPAVHERVKRLRRDGTIRASVALLKPSRVGKPLLAFVHVDTVGWGKTPELMALQAFPEVEEIHSVAGDTCMLLKVRTSGTHALEQLLGKLYATPGVKATRSYVVLSTYLERCVQPRVTQDWNAPIQDSVEASA